MKMNILKLIFFALIITVSFSSCKDDEFDEDVNNTDDPRDAIKNTWKCNEDGGTTFGYSEYDVDIFNHPFDKTKILMSNFFNLGTEEEQQIFATISDKKLTIPLQTIGSTKISGNGDISADSKSIIWAYDVDDGTNEGKITASFTVSVISK